MNTLNLQGEQLELFNQIASLDNESFAKVKKYVKRVIHKHPQIKPEEILLEDIDIITDEEIENAMKPLTDEEKLSRLIKADNDSFYYTQDEMRKAVASWRHH